MGLCNNCYNELYKDHKTHISLDKMWLNLAQSFRDENEKLQEKISDLEAKLAESEKKAYSRGHSQRDIANEIKLNALREDVANKEKRIVELKQQLAESEKSKESYRLQNEHHHLQLLQFYSRLGVEAFGADIHEKALETLMIMKEEIEEKKGLERALSACNRQNDEFSDMIKKLVNEKEQLKQQLHDLPKKIVGEIRKWGQKHYNWVGDGTGYDGQDYNECIGFNMAIDQLNEILDTILKKYGGEDE